MAGAGGQGWGEHAMTRLQEAGLRRGGARRAVVETLAGHDCAVTAIEIEDELRSRESAVGRASVYRALDQLEELGLVQRFEASRGTASYERVDPGGHHHHHAICSVCGRMEAFEDRDLESAIGRIEGKLPFEVSEHDVVLRGRCDRCAGRAA
ncbi:MAG TPA: Fur family transcriptional regulator [Solirubrobacterales bacterium]